LCAPAGDGNEEEEKEKEDVGGSSSSFSLGDYTGDYDVDY